MRRRYFLEKIFIGEFIWQYRILWYICFVIQRLTNLNDFGKLYTPLL
jgi:hypothetical protein